MGDTMFSFIIIMGGYNRLIISSTETVVVWAGWVIFVIRSVSKVEYSGGQQGCYKRPFEVRNRECLNYPVYSLHTVTYQTNIDW